ncbi:uncharacterized protein B0H18DRAFT_170054 [Fomitopsis serialis]|uniref:uncharacterized protein n=1 Tax=Fomitopsis serialis TaxID=139415 RepID=UPI002007A20F|nr:uncharacterized protein B0H18DRAFT_170054 [Neoantrodia serialis]KAH9913438.1 hypothetical protein B0H18DRAFT_170054 [Neoantrodia serialis]
MNLPASHLHLRVANLASRCGLDPWGPHFAPELWASHVSTRASSTPLLGFELQFDMSVSSVTYSGGGSGVVDCSLHPWGCAPTCQMAASRSDEHVSTYASTSHAGKAGALGATHCVQASVAPTPNRLLGIPGPARHSSPDAHPSLSLCDTKRPVRSVPPHPHRDAPPRVLKPFSKAALRLRCDLKARPSLLHEMHAYKIRAERVSTR